MARQKKCPECPKVGAPEYMLTYGDMMTLLLTFFVLLITFSSVEQSKFSMAATSLRGALGVLQGTQGQVLPLTKMPLFSIGIGKADKMIEELIKEMRSTAQKTGENEKLKITHNKDTIHFSLAAPMLFTTGSADLKETAKPILKLISDILVLFPYEIRVEGHTDNLPINSPIFPSNWELSFSRALSVTRQLNDFGVNSSRFQVIGYGDTRPIADNSTEDGRELNRRVEIYINLRGEVRKSIISSAGE
ncbi:MAG TPA: OmpA family protein [Candidatus Cloacimonadota bacterium]|nr:OmpA family protein [Candidatus Cloacimonadota bacterium]HQB40937.1 OmpA family protein [Candidatus Cloacimonadota bacterium]